VPEPGSRELSVSWSRIRTHEDCKQRAWLAAQGKRASAPDIRMYFHGTVVDRCMRQWLDSDDPQPGQMAEMVSRVIDEEEATARETGDGVIRWRGPDDREHVRKWCTELVNRLEPILYERVIPLSYQPAIRFKVPFQVPYLDGTPQRIFLAGELDLLTQDSGGQFFVWDLKGTADDSYWRKVIGQLLFYDLAVAVQFGSFPARCGLIQPMCKEPVLEFTFGPEQRAQLGQHLVAYCHDVWRGIRPPKASAQGCDICEVRHACEKYAVRGGRAVLSV
jgi:hypothetical protein